jgi:hypothetical protein
MVASKPGQKSEQSPAACTDHSELASGWRVVRFLPILQPLVGHNGLRGQPAGHRPRAVSVQAREDGVTQRGTEL